MMVSVKSNIHVRLGVISFGDGKIKCLQALAWWVMDFTMRGKKIDLNDFKSDVLSGAIEESLIDF